MLELEKLQKSYRKNEVLQDVSGDCCHTGATIWSDTFVESLSNIASGRR